jgi:hypothetical protein
MARIYGKETPWGVGVEGRKAGVLRGEQDIESQAIHGVRVDGALYGRQE